MINKNFTPCGWCGGGGGCRVPKINRGQDIMYIVNIYKCQMCSCNTFVCRLTRFSPPGGGSKGGYSMAKISSSRGITCTDNMYKFQNDRCNIVYRVNKKYRWTHLTHSLTDKHLSGISPAINREQA